MTSERDLCFGMTPYLNVKYNVRVGEEAAIWENLLR